MLKPRLDDSVQSFDVSEWLLDVEAEEDRTDMRHSLYKIPDVYNEGEDE